MKRSLLCVAALSMAFAMSGVSMASDHVPTQSIDIVQLTSQVQSDAVAVADVRQFKIWYAVDLAMACGADSSINSDGDVVAMAGYPKPGGGGSTNPCNSQSGNDNGMKLVVASLIRLRPD